MRSVLGTLIAALVLTQAAVAFQRETTDDEDCTEAPGVNCAHNGIPLEWKDIPVSFVVNPDGSGLSSGATRGAVERAFQTWQDGSNEGIVFVSEGTTSAGTSGVDGQNVVRWRAFSGDSSAFARSILTFDTTNGEILDVDIELNSNFEWAVLPAGQNDPTDPKVDIQAVVTHESGHFLGLDHENRFGPQVVMYFSDTSGSTVNRTLHSDDVTGVRTIYPSGGSGDLAEGESGGGGGGCSAGPGPSGALGLILPGLFLLWRSMKRR